MFSTLSSAIGWRATAALIASACPLIAAPIALFDGKTLDGWESPNPDIWRVEDGAIHGGSMAGNPRNEFLATVKSYQNFILRLEYKLVGTEGFINSGIQFHSQRIAAPPNEMSGYQADIGAGYSGFLYDESRRNRMLATADEEQVKKIEKPGDWNRYEIRAEGGRVRLSLNGELTVDYTEEDPNIPQQGRIALQIHGDCKAVVSFRNITLEELPEQLSESAKEVLSRFGNPDAPSERPAPWNDQAFSLADREVVVFAGQANAVREQKAGTLEAKLATAYAQKRPVFRSMAWEADTVYEQWRDLNFGSWKSQLQAVGATVVVAQFGQLEALDGRSELPRFAAAYHHLLDQFAAVTPRLVLISPMPFEKPAQPHAPDLTRHNDDVKAYAEAIREIARQRGAVFVDLLASLSDGGPRLTHNGMHLTEDGLTMVADTIASQLGANSGRTVPDALRAAIIEKNRLWFDCWRPANWSFAYGDRVTQLYGKAAGNQPSLRESFEKHKPLVAALDTRIHALARGETPPVVAPPPAPATAASPPLSVAEQLAGFTLAEGYQISLFASEDLGVAKPVQISWDEKGRLYVACSPTYPQTLPGIPPSDYILVLEDSDGDGRADKSIRFAEGLTMVQGLEPGRGGLYVCDFDQILHLRDTDGDGRADKKEILLSGFGIGDTHQLVNSISHGPDGSLWFTQGLHAFSRVETPRGLSRLDKAGLWRFEPRTLRLDGYFNGAAAGHNCWGVAFDDYNQIFHKSGDRPHGYYSLPGLVRLADPEDYHPVANLFDSNPKTTALDFIGTRALPDEIQGAALIAGYFGSVVELHRLIDDGSGFTSEQLPRLLTSSDPSFRPVDVSVGPDGAIYLADWFNPVIGHYQASYADPRRDRSHGRIWRITATDKASVRPPNLATMMPTQLLEQLRSPERWTRYQAKRLLFDAPTDEVLAAADSWIDDLDAADPQFEKLLLEVAGIFESHQAPRPNLLDQLIAADDFRVRAYGARVAGRWNAAGPLAKTIQDEHPRVRLESIVASSYLKSPEAVGITLQALDRPRDRFLDYALTQSVRAQQPHWAPALAAGKLYLENTAHLAYLHHLLETEREPDPRGRIIYETLCLNCHQADGRGLPGVYPPLAHSARLTGDKAAPIKILLHGMTSERGQETTANRAPTSLPMPPMGLDDQQTADVLTFVRASFGNEAAPVTAEEVKAIRAATSDHTSFWTPDELGN